MAPECDFTDLPVRELIRLHRASLAELFRRGVVRTMNAPTGEWAELIVAEAVGGQVAENLAEAGWDVRTASGERIQVKARVARRRSETFSPFRDWDFDSFIGVVLETDDLSVAEGYRMGVETVREHAHRVDHLNGWRLTVVQVREHGEDITDQLRGGEANLG